MRWRLIVLWSRSKRNPYKQFQPHVGREIISPVRVIAVLQLVAQETKRKRSSKKMIQEIDTIDILINNVGHDEIFFVEKRSSKSEQKPCIQ